jgi:integrase/recombinase XerD
MFEQLFERPKALARQHAAPLVEERRAYLTHLAVQGTARWTLREIARYLVAVAESLRIAQRPGELITIAEIRERAALWADLPRQSRTVPPSPAVRPRFIRFATAWLRFMGRLQLPVRPATPFDAWIAEFSEHLQRDAGVSGHTVRNHSRYALDFLQLLAVAPADFLQVTVSRIETTLVQKFTDAGYARNTVRHYGEALRAFFRYAQARQWCPEGLAEGILLPRIYQLERLPSGPSWPIVQDLLARASGDSPSDIRVRALLLLLATYGLRAGEVVRLCLEDFDWGNETLTVARPKTGRSQAYPLCRTVGRAVLRYLRAVRPRTPHRQVFLFSRAPYAPLTRTALTALVRRRFLALGTELPWRGPHALRHACAAHLLECGMSFREIGDHLGHQHPDSTRIYAKVDVAQLRRVADIDLGDLL